MSKGKQPQQLQWFDDADFPEHFANQARVRLNPCVARIEFGSHIPGDDEIFIKVAIVQTPQHMKLLAEHLMRCVAEYEQTFGPLVTEPLPKPGDGEQVH